jgi:hypothetical protein
LASVQSSLNSFAEDKIKIGFIWVSTASGFIGPEVLEMLLNKVIPESTAEKARLEIGHQLQGYAIPGCTVLAAKNFVNTPESYS